MTRAIVLGPLRIAAVDARTGAVRVLDRRPGGRHRAAVEAAAVREFWRA